MTLREGFVTRSKYLVLATPKAIPSITFHIRHPFEPKNFFGYSLISLAIRLRSSRLSVITIKISKNFYQFVSAAQFSNTYSLITAHGYRGVCAYVGAEML